MWGLDLIGNARHLEFKMAVIIHSKWRSYLIQDAPPSYIQDGRQQKSKMAAIKNSSWPQRFKSKMAAIKNPKWSQSFIQNDGDG